MTATQRPLTRLARPLSFLALLCGACIWCLALLSGGNPIFLGAFFGYLPMGLPALAFWWVPAVVFFILLIIAWIRRSTLLALTAFLMPHIGILLYLIRLDLLA